METQPEQRPAARPGGARRVALGILSSRLVGLAREATLAFFFGVGAHSDVFRVALRVPNLLQNLLGEQVLSASFIPVYARLLGRSRAEEAGRFAGAVFGLLLALVAGLTLIGVVLAEPIVALTSPGYLGDAADVAAGVSEVDRYPRAVSAVRLVFPMAGLLVLSAWCLGVLNSHRRFLLPYAAPVLWNAAIVAALWWAGLEAADPSALAARDRILVAGLVGALVGGALQFAVQLPLVARLMRGFRLSLSIRVEGVREALRSFTPLVAGRGGVQLSGYLDLLLASLLAEGAQAAMGWGYMLYLLPISLFGASVAAAELPELAERSDGGAGGMAPRVRLALRRTLFPSIAAQVGYLVLGLVVVGAVYRRGDFGLDDTWLVYLVLAAYALGLPAAACSRLLNNVFFAVGRTGIPARIGVERVLLAALAGVGPMLWLDRFPVATVAGATPGGETLFLGAAGLALGGGLAAWYELARLRWRLRAVVPELALPWAYAGRLVLCALAACAPAGLLWGALAGRGPLLQAAVVLPAYALGYLAVTRLAGLSEARHWLGLAGRRTKR